MKKDETFKWDDKKFVEFYADSADVIILERQRLIRLLLEIVYFHFPSLAGLNILDLGCGDGIISRHIYNKSPDNSFFLVDASELEFKVSQTRPYPGGVGVVAAVLFFDITYSCHCGSQDDSEESLP